MSNIPELDDFNFKEFTNTQLNTWMLRDALNDTRKWLREHVLFEEELEEKLEQLGAVEGSDTEYQEERKLKPGVKVLKDGRTMLDGKFIKKENAYL